MSDKFKPFFTLITFTAVVILNWSILNTNWTKIQLLNLLVFGCLAIAGESLPVALPKGGYVTVTYTILVSSLILFPLGVTLTVQALSGLLIFGKESTGPLYKKVFNAAQFVVSVATAHWAMSIFTTPTSILGVQAIVYYVSLAAIYLIVNVTIVAIALPLIYNKSPNKIWLSNLKWALPNFGALVPLGFLLALLYKNWGAGGILLLFIPLLMCRHSFQLYIDLRDNYLSTVGALIQALEAKDTYTSGHSERVEKLSVAMAEELKMNEEAVQAIKYAAVLHDVGKIGVSEAILNKEGKLLDSEWNAIRNHPVMGQNIIKGIKFLSATEDVVRHHHERYDGKGYPDGVKGKDIPLGARIIAVADTYDAITSDRSYRKGATHDIAIAEIKKVAGTQLDPEIVEVFCRAFMVETILEINRTMVQTMVMA